MGKTNFFKIIYCDLIRFHNCPNKKHNFFLWIKIIHPKFLPILLIRIARLLYKSIFFRPFSSIPMFINFFLYGIEVTPKCDIGEGLFLPHTSGTVIGANKIGKNVTIFQGVTLGAKYADTEYRIETRPSVGNNIVIGSGAKILGNITIGDNSIISANSLVIESVPNDVTVIGIPAIIKKRSNG